MIFSFNLGRCEHLEQGRKLNIKQARRLGTTFFYSCSHCQQVAVKWVGIMQLQKGKICNCSSQHTEYGREGQSEVPQECFTPLVLPSNLNHWKVSSIHLLVWITMANCFRGLQVCQDTELWGNMALHCRACQEKWLPPRLLRASLDSLKSRASCFAIFNSSGV